MSYTRMLYLDEVEALLDKVEKVVLDNQEVSVELKTQIQEFIFEMDQHLKKDVSNVYLRDLRALGERKPFFPVKRSDL